MESNFDSNSKITDNKRLEQKYKIEQLRTSDINSYPEQGDCIKIHYTGALVNGKKVDSSRDKKRPFNFVVGVGQCIQGWDELLLNMRVGERISAVVPYGLAYGDRDIGNGLIPAKSDIVYDLELLEIVRRYLI